MAKSLPGLAKLTRAAATNRAATTATSCPAPRSKATWLGGTLKSKALGEFDVAATANAEFTTDLHASLAGDDESAMVAR